ncbi:MAG: C39 family peptidase [Candidatus Moraniibacteriota bacterium]
MIKKILKIILIIFLSIVAVAVLVFTILNLPAKDKFERANLGVTFSSRYSSDIGLDWRANYVAMLDDLGVRKVRIPVYWDLVETEKNKYNFDDIDWQLAEAKKRNTEIILTIGQKVPRWPECFVPKWVADDEERKAELVEFLKIVVKRYQGNSEIKYWQIENEPFLKFGVCPELDEDLLDREIKIVKQMDDTRQIIVTDSGELSTWLPAASRADVFGTTMYRNVYKEGWGYYVYPIGPRFFLIKKWVIDKFANQENAIVIELQGEPWVKGWTVHQPLEEQFKSMNEKKLVENVIYAKKSGFDTIYIWGVEWWYWLKTSQNNPILWDTAKNLFEDNFSDELRKELAEKKEVVKNEEVKKESGEEKVLEVEEKSLDKVNIKVPFISQAPLGVWDERHEEACEETSLIMLNAYLKNGTLDKNSGEKEIQKIIDFQIEKYGDYKDTSAKETVKLARDFYGLDNLKVVYDFTQEDIKKYLSKGNPIIVPAAGRALGNPNFTAPGPLYHNLILTGFTQDDLVITNDPGTRKGENYTYKLSVLYEAIHDFDGNKEEIAKGRKAMIVVE